MKTTAYGKPWAVFFGAPRDYGFSGVLWCVSGGGGDLGTSKMEI